MLNIFYNLDMGIPFGLGKMEDNLSSEDWVGNMTSQNKRDTVIYLEENDFSKLSHIK